MQSKPQTVTDAAGKEIAKSILQWVPQPTVSGTAFDPKRDMEMVSCKKGDYSLGMIDFCPEHGVNVATLHTQGRCNQHKRKLRAIHAAKANVKAEVEARDARAAFIRKHGIHARVPLAPRP